MGSVFVQRDNNCTLNYTDNPKWLEEQLAVSIKRMVISANICLLLHSVHFDISFLMSFLSPACPILTLEFGILAVQ